MQSREKKGYALKRERGLVPHQYDKGSRSFNRGAWKNWSYQEMRKESPERQYAYRAAMDGR